jgi:hypothetical protein
LIVNPTSIEIPRRIRRTLRSLLFKQGLTAYVKNKFSLEDSYQIIKTIDPDRAREKGTIEAQTVGFAAYVIHAKRLFSIIS